MKGWPPVWLYIKPGTMTGVNFFAQSTALIRSRKPTFAGWPTKRLFQPTVPWELSKPRPLPQQATKKEGRNEEYARSSVNCDSRRCAGSESHCPSDLLATGSDSALACISPGGTQAHRTAEWHGHLPSGRPRAPNH